MEGFTLRCNKCGREVKLKGNKFYNKQWDDDYNQKIILGVNWYSQEVEIKCECGNEIREN